MELKTARILVTGGAGFIGSNFIRFALANEVFQGKLVNLDLLTYAADQHPISDDSRYCFVQGDICNGELLRQLYETHQFDLIVHFAAESHVDRSIVDPRTFLETNIIGTYEVLELVRQHPEIHFHHISTDEVYGSILEGSCNELSPHQPNSPYSASKAASDHLVRAYHKTYGIKMTLSRSSNNYGPYQFPDKFIPLMILNCMNKEALPLYGSGENIRDWLYVEDHVKAIWMVLDRGIPGETYNIGGGSEWRNIDLLHHLTLEFAAIVHQDVEEYRNLITFVPDRLGHDFRYAIDTTKIEKEIGFTPEYDLVEGLQKTIKWYLKHEEDRLRYTS